MGSKTKIKTWGVEVLTKDDLNAEVDNFYNNPMQLISPCDESLDLNAQTLIMDADQDTTIAAGTDDTLVFTVGGATISTMTASGQTITLCTGITFASGTLDMDGSKIDLDDDQDSSIRETADDVLAMELQGFDAFIFDGDVATPVAGLTFTSAAEAGDVGITVQGSGTDAGLALTTKGAGNLNLVPGTGVVQIDGGTLAGKCFNTTFVWDILNLNADQDTETGITVTGASVGDFVLVSCTTTDLVRISLFGFVASSNNVTVIAKNLSSSAIDLSSQTFAVRVLSLA